MEFRLCNGSRFVLVPLDTQDPAVVAALLRVYEQCNDFLALGPALASQAMVEADLERARVGGHTVLGITDAETGALVGVLDFLPAGFEGDPEAADLELLMIAAPWRGMGLGEAVFAWLEETLRRDGRARMLYSGVQVNNPKAIRFWQRMGFGITAGPIDMPDQTTVYTLEKPL